MGARVTRRKPTVDLSAIVPDDADPSERVRDLFGALQSTLSEYNGLRSTVSGDPRRGQSPVILVELATRAAGICAGWVDAVTADADAQIAHGLVVLAEVERQREVEREERAAIQAEAAQRSAAIQAANPKDDGLVTVWYGSSRDL